MLSLDRGSSTGTEQDEAIISISRTAIAWWNPEPYSLPWNPLKTKEGYFRNRTCLALDLDFLLALDLDSSFPLENGLNYFSSAGIEARDSRSSCSLMLQFLSQIDVYQCVVENAR
jgi:hypothetical protein